MLTRLLPFVMVLSLLSSPALAQSGRSEADHARWFPAPPVEARAAVVINVNNGAVLDAVNPHRHLPMASTTKIMTALLALRLGHLSDRIVVPAAAFNFESDATVMGLHPGQVVSLHDLLYGLLLPSGADAADTIAIHYAGSEARFVAMMNREAAVLGMRDTHYVTPHGLDAPHQYSSAYDLARLGRYVSSISTLMKIVGTRQYNWNGHVLTNVNQVLFWYPGVDGIKPGFTDAAGLCQVLDARRHGRHIIAAILNTPDLVHDARDLLNYGLDEYTWIQSPLAGDSPSMIQSGTDRRGWYVYYPASGHYVRPPFWTAYAGAGGPPVLGYPRTEPLQEGHREVQYFENGELALNTGARVPSRVAMGSLLSDGQPSKPSPTPTQGPGNGHTGTSGMPTATATPMPTPTAMPTTASPFRAFIRHQKFPAGSATTQPQWIHHYQIQIFRYAALAYDTSAHRVYVLPAGDRFLTMHGYLPAYAGNSYPAGFAPAALMRAIGWNSAPFTQ